MSHKVITYDEGVSKVSFKKNDPVAKKSTGGGKHSVHTKKKTSTMTPTPPPMTTANDITLTPPPTMTTATDIMTSELATDTADSTVTTMTPTPPPMMTTATNIVTTEFTTLMTYNIVMTITPTPPPTATVTDMITELATDTADSTVTIMAPTPPMMTTATDIVTTELATDTADSTVTTMPPTPLMTTTATDIVTTEFATLMTETIAQNPVTSYTVTSYPANYVIPTINETTNVTATPEILVKKEHYDLAWCEFSFHTLDQVLKCDYINTVIKDNSFMIGLGKMMQLYDNVTDIDPLNEDQYMYMVNGMTTHIEGHPTDKALQCNFQKAPEIHINKDVRIWDVAMRNLGSYMIEEEVMELEDKKIELPYTFTIDSVHRVRVAEHIMCKFRKKNVVIPDIHSVTHSLMARVYQPRLRCSQQIYREYYLPKIRYDNRVISLHADPPPTKPPVVMSDNVYREIVWEDGILKSISPEEIEEEVEQDIIVEEITRMPDIFCCKMSVSRVSPLGEIRESRFPCWSFINPFTKDPLIVKKGDDVVTNNNCLE